MTLALASSKAFASHGFAGTVQSTLALALGRPGRPTRAHSGTLPGSRQITVLYRARLSGSIAEHFGGAADPDVCTPLGSCGLTGTETLTPHAGGEASINAIARASTPAEDLLAAVGVGGRRRVKGVVVTGAVSLDGGGAAEAVEQGTETCHDSAPLGAGAGTILLGTSRGQLRADYLAGFGTFAARTRCPGPAVAGAAALATGAIPVTELAHRTIRLSLTHGGTFADYGYGVHTLSHLELTLTRVRVSVRTPVGGEQIVSGSTGGSSGSFSGVFFGP
jgi:hypothetical protein